SHILTNKQTNKQRSSHKRQQHERGSEHSSLSFGIDPKWSWCCIRTFDAVTVTATTRCSVNPAHRLSAEDHSRNSGRELLVRNEKQNIQNFSNLRS
ncbi:hypothetical protein V3C99_002779, partial [Haemonchus contortus]|uniref:Ovule protein n=1 Tax=Haemonchus contortus TaxID=6289 RepID=A0A7I4Y972_HAECO